MQVNGPEGQKLTRKKSLAVSVVRIAIYRPTPGFKGKTFNRCVLNRWDFNFCVRSSPLRGFRPGQSTVEQIFNSRVFTGKYPQHQRHLFHNFMNFQEVFDRIWHADLWQVLRSFEIVEGLVQAILTLQENSSSTVLFNSRVGEFFETTVRVCQGC